MNVWENDNQFDNDSLKNETGVVNPHFRCPFINTDAYSPPFVEQSLPAPLRIPDDDGNFHFFCAPFLDPFCAPWPLSPSNSVSVKTCHEIWSHLSHQLLVDDRHYSYVKDNNVSRLCLVNGTWESRATYEQCHFDPPISGAGKPPDFEFMDWIYFFGNAISGISAIVALVIFGRYRSLRCLRNKIHSQLIFSILMKILFWAVLQISASQMWFGSKENRDELGCKTVNAVHEYFVTVPFFWMLLEALYLHLMVVWAFGMDNLKFSHFLVCGWIFPLLPVGCWFAIRLSHSELLCHQHSLFQLIYVVPIFISLMINLILLLTILWVLVTKLRGQNSLENRNYRQAFKAILFLFHLFGLNYILLVSHPRGNPVFRILFYVFNPLTESLQGFFVSLFFCFANKEVKEAVKRELNSRRRDPRRASGGTRSERSELTLVTQDAGNPGETIRLTELESAQETI